MKKMDNENGNCHGLFLSLGRNILKLHQPLKFSLIYLINPILYSSLIICFKVQNIGLEENCAPLHAGSKLSFYP